MLPQRSCIGRPCDNVETVTSSGKTPPVAAHPLPMGLHVYRWRGLSFLFEPGRVPEVGTFEGVEELSPQGIEAWREMLIDAILDEAKRN